MMCNDVLTLISETITVNDYGDAVIAETNKNVFCAVKSVGMRETYEALSVGLKPEYTFILADYYEYSGQERVKYNGVEYRVLRTYRNSNQLEMVVTRSVDA